MSEHTKGRLVAEKGLFSWVVRWYFGARGIWCDDLDEDEARRLAACWNACEGLDTEQLEALPEPFAGLALGELMAVRKELTAARALLREVLFVNEWTVDSERESEAHKRAHDYLDACDTLGDGNG